MNPYFTYSDLLFTCVNTELGQAVELFATRFNEPELSNVEQAFLNPFCNEVQIFEDGKKVVYRRDDPLPPRPTKSSHYFTKPVSFDLGLIHLGHAERDGTKPQRILFWEPRIHPGTTAFMGVFDDGLNYSVMRLSQESPHAWVNIRIYDDETYPGCFLEYYADRHRIARIVGASKQEDGWEFLQDGPVQAFEDPANYRQRRIQDRLTKAIVTDYLAKLGYLISQDGFWETAIKAQLLWRERIPPPE